MPDPERFVVEGEIAVLRLLQSEYGVESVVATSSRIDRLAGSIAAHVPLLRGEAEDLRALVGFDFHRGCLACARRPSAEALDPDSRMAPLLSHSAARIVVAERLADPVNVGALLRNCHAFGVDLVVLDEKGADPWNRRAIRASMGSVFDQPLAIASGLDAWIAGLSRHMPRGWRMLAATVDPEATAVATVDPAGSMVLLVGNEGAGLSAALRSRATEEVTIPLRRGFDSLNVAAATAILLDRLCPR
jgi:tRNA G18 (ribose-2'-O)-methylase SpoU